MKRILLVVLSMVVLTGCGRSNGPATLSSINIIDRNGFSETIRNEERLKQYADVNFLEQQPYQKVMRVFARDSHGNIKAYITSYHPNGHPKQYLEVVNNRANGVYREWHVNGTLKLDTFVIGGTADLDTGAERTWLFDGKSSAWDDKGNLIAEIPYHSGVLEGVSTFYHANGQMWKQEPCHEGKIQGTYCIYLENGELLQTMEYVAGLKHGPAKRYWKPDVVAADETFCDGFLTLGNYYDICGKLVCSVKNGEGLRAIFSKNCISEIHEYHQGKLEGLVKVFGSSGALISTHNVRNGLKHGEETEYYPCEKSGKELAPMLSVNWAEGKIQGIVKTWYPNGVMESKREMINNKKNGLFSAWYPDGSVMMMEEYDQGKLVRGEYFTAGERMPISQVAAGKGIATLFDSDGNLMRKITYNSGKPLIE